MSKHASEHHEQAALIDWCRWQRKKYPETEFLFAIPNGGLRHKRTAVKLKREGVKAGVSDLFLPVPKGEFHGLWIEMKSKKGRPTKAQKKWLKDMKELGYQTAICYGAEEAIEVLKEYLKE